MLVTILTTVGLLTLILGVGVVFWQDFRIRSNRIVVDENWDGPGQVSTMLKAILRYLMKRSIYFRKFLTQYILHFFVRVMYYIDKVFSWVYSKSRDMFVSHAVKNMGTVPHFWEHLKVYKKEMDKEKKEE